VAAAQTHSRPPILDLMAASQTGVYTIWCALADETTLFSIETTSFSIEIERNKTVDALKKKIREERKNTLANIDAARLKLYYIEILDFDKMAPNDKKEKIKDCLETKPEMASKTKLADIFGDEVKEEAYIIAQSPISGK
jgi:Crinkler effector protein N-terminal domain